MEKRTGTQLGPAGSLLLGGLAGALATVPMSLVMAATHAAGLMDRPAPKQITARAEAKAGLRDDVRGRAFQASWLIAHFSYGAACGALYRIIHRRLPFPRLAAGLGYGLLIWAASYLGVMPMLGLYPRATHDHSNHQAALIAAHLVYGSTLAALTAWQDHPQQQRGSPQR